MINDEKSKLRQQIKRYRAELDINAKTAMDNNIFSNIIKTGVLTRYSLVLSYISTAIEVDTSCLIDYCLDKGIQVAVPRCRKKRQMDFYFYNKESIMERSVFGIYEPVPHRNEIVDKYDNALCIVPALAFDQNGYRLGYGGGFYDTFIGLNDNVTYLGICYSDNIIEKLPTGEYDKSVDLIVTDNFTEVYNG